MGHGHGHSHGHDDHDHDHDHDGGHGRHVHGLDAPSTKLAWALGLTVSFLAIEVAAGFYTKSLALLSDAGHMLTDSGALVLALVAQRIAARPRTRLHTFGFRRAEILAALVNGMVLVAMAAVVVVEALQRLGSPPDVKAGPMLVVAVIGLFVNLLSAVILGHGLDQSNPNVRAALAHVISDALGSVASIAAGVLLLWFDLPLADPLASLFIALLIAIGAIRLVRETTGVLMEAAPFGVNLETLERVVLETPGVRGFHDLHAWSISEGFPAVSVHVVLDGSAHGTDVAQLVGNRVRERFGITHVTVQPESPGMEDQLVPVHRLTRRNGNDARTS